MAEDAAVAYVVSGDLIRYSDLLPSNIGRSSLVHSLAYHLDLLDLSTLREEQEEEHERLLSALHADTQSQCAGRKRAQVYLPRAATRTQLTAYHQSNFIDSLIEKSNGKSRKRAKTAHELDDHSSDSELSDGSETSLPHDESPQRHQSKNQFGLQDDCPRFDGLRDHVALVAGASIRAAELVASGEVKVAIAWDGGRHHAKKDSASGFCYVNDAVLAILALRKPRKPSPLAPKRFDRVMYIDLDLHWGDGVEEAFYTSPNVLTLSVHHFAPGFFPCYATASNPDKHGPPGSLTSEGGVGSKSLNIPLGLGTSDASLERIMTSVIQPLYKAWCPEVIVVQCGVDGLAEDPMSVWNLSTSAYVDAIQKILAWRKPTVLLGGGGYASENAARCWSLLTAACLGRISEDSSRHARLTTSQTDLDRISATTVIPDHKYWPSYQPEYALQVPAGEMIDQNDETHFTNIQTTMQKHIDTIIASRQKSTSKTQ